MRTYLLMLSCFSHITPRIRCGLYNQYDSVPVKPRSDCADQSADVLDNSRPSSSVMIAGFCPDLWHHRLSATISTIRVLLLHELNTTLVQSKPWAGRFPAMVETTTQTLFRFVRRLHAFRDRHALTVPVIRPPVRYRYGMNDQLPAMHHIPSISTVTSIGIDREENSLIILMCTGVMIYLDSVWFN